MEPIDYIQNLQDSKNTKYNTKVVCRTCGGIFREEYELCSIFDLNIIDELTSMKIDIFEYDDLPQQICQGCLQEFINYSKFRDKCKKTQNELYEYFKEETQTIIEIIPLEVKNEMHDSEDYLKEETVSPPALYENTEEDNYNELDIDSNVDDDVLVSINYKKKKEKIKSLKFKENTSILSILIEKCYKCNKYCHEDKIKHHQSVCSKLQEKSDKVISIDDVNFCCCYCDKEFQLEKDIQNHLINDHPINRPYTCTFCDKSYKSNTELENHIEYHNNEESYNCKLCNKNYKTRKSYSSHIKVNHKNDGSFECSICSKKFPNSNKYRAHLKCHEKSTKYECEYCSKLYKFKPKLEEHLRTHTGEKPLICEKCGESFSRKNGLYNHMNKHHPKVPLQCELCERVFKSKSDLENHMYSHSEDGIRPVRGQPRRIKTENRLQCPQCPQTFMSPSAFERHIKVHDANRRYPCSECKCSYNTSAHLKRHFSRTHTNVKYICKYCNREFRDPGVKRDHEKLHNYGEYECRICRKIFYSERAVRNHELQHGGGSVFKCVICNAQFNNVPKLSRHCRYKHSAAEIAKVYISQKFVENGNNIATENLSPDDVTQVLLNHFASTSNPNPTDIN